MDSKIVEKAQQYVKSAAFIAMLGAISLAATCQSKIDLSPAAFVSALEKLGWTYSDPPRGILGPGSIVTVTQANGIKYRSALSTCISDPDILKIKEGPIAITGTISGSASFDISLLASYEAISVGPDFNKLKNFSLTIKTATEQALDSFKVKDWIATNRGALSSSCADALLGKPGEKLDSVGGYFVLTDVLKVTGYKYTFHDETGAKISLSPANLSKYFTLSASSTYKATGDGDLEVSDGDLYIAFQQDVSTKIGGPGAVATLSAKDILKSHSPSLYGN
jgi:hypothetical protein